MGALTLSSSEDTLGGVMVVDESADGVDKEWPSDVFIVIVLA